MTYTPKFVLQSVDSVLSPSSQLESPVTEKQDDLILSFSVCWIVFINSTEAKVASVATEGPGLNRSCEKLRLGTTERTYERLSVKE